MVGFVISSVIPSRLPSSSKLKVSAFSKPCRSRLTMTTRSNPTPLHESKNSKVSPRAFFLSSISPFHLFYGGIGGGSRGSNGGNNSGGNDYGWGKNPPHALPAAILLSRRPYKKLPDWYESRNNFESSLKRFCMKLRISHLLLAMNVAVFALQYFYGPSILMKGAKVNSAIAAGQVYRLLSPIFLHASITHLLVNSFSLQSTGPSVESWFGKKRFFTLYVTSGILGNVLSYMCTPTPSVGASGAIFGLVGASAVILARHNRILGPRARKGLQSLAYIVVMNFGMGLTPGSRIDNYGHLGGFLGGIAYSYLFGPRLVLRRTRSGKTSVHDVPLFSLALRDAQYRLRALRNALIKK